MTEEQEPIPSTQPEVPAEPLAVNPQDIIALAATAAARLEAANKITEQLITRQEALKVQQTLGGSAYAGVPSQTDEEKKDEAAKDFLKGTGYEDELFKKP